MYWFCHTSTWIRHRYTCVPYPEPPSLLPPHTIPLGHLSAPAPSIQYHASNLDWRLISYMILYMFQCHSPKSSHPHPHPQSPKDCSIHLCLFCCLAYRDYKFLRRKSKKWSASFNIKIMQYNISRLILSGINLQQKQNTKVKVKDTDLIWSQICPSLLQC